MSGFEEIIKELKLLSASLVAKRAGRHGKAKDVNGIFVYLPKVSDFTKKEIDFHDQIHQDEIEVHQLNTIRNYYYHNYFLKWLYKLPQDSTILEIGSGSGFDLMPLIKQGYNVIASDISQGSVESIQETVKKKSPLYENKVAFLVADGQNLPFKDNSVDATFLVATFHHFEDQVLAFKEIKRVTKKNGLIILAMEPSRFMMRFTKLFKNSKKLRIHSSYSEADETHNGFIKSDFKKLINHNASIIKIKRVWLLLGFLHYKLEALHRIFKLKKRLKAPRLFEWLLLVLDEILLQLPIINQLNWHWIIIIQNK